MLRRWRDAHLKEHVGEGRVGVHRLRILAVAALEIDRNVQLLRRTACHRRVDAAGLHVRQEAVFLHGCVQQVQRVVRSHRWPLVTGISHVTPRLVHQVERQVGLLLQEVALRAIERVREQRAGRRRAVLERRPRQHKR